MDHAKLRSQNDMECEYVIKDIITY